MTLLLQLNLGFAWGDTTVAPQSLGLWHSLGASYDTNTTDADTVPQVMRNTDIGQVIQADIDAS